MNLKKILYPTDFSELSAAALNYASRLAAESGATLYVVHVDEQFHLNAAMGEPCYLYASQRDVDIKNALEKIVPTVAGVKCEHHCLDGAPVEELLQFAKREDVDLIVLGSHGRTGLSRLLMGSIAEGITRRAECPVLVVKQPAKDDALVLTAEDLVAHG
jgi:universal stress protein A